MKRLFNVRTGLVVMFSLLMISYGVLIVFYVNSLYNATTATPDPPVDVLRRYKYPDGSTIKVPSVVVAGKPFVYETKGEKLVENQATVKLQIDCKVLGDTRQITPLGDIFSTLPKGEFNISRSFTIPVSTRLQPSDDCKLQTASTYTFYTTDRNGSERAFNVIETGESASFRLEVPVEPATQPAD